MNCSETKLLGVTQTIKDVSPSRYDADACVFDPTVVGDNLQTFENRTADDFLARHTFDFGELGQGIVKFFVGPQEHRHAAKLDVR